MSKDILAFILIVYISMLLQEVKFDFVIILIIDNIKEISRSSYIWLG